MSEQRCQPVNFGIKWLLRNFADAKRAMLKVWEIFPTAQSPGTSTPSLVITFPFCTLDLLRRRKYSKPEEIKMRTAIHAAFTEVSLFRSIVLDESSSDAPSIRLSLTNVVAKG